MQLQQDGAKPHVQCANQPAFDEQGCQDGWKLQVVTQPANSPDLNWLDLAFFCSLETRVDKQYSLTTAWSVDMMKELVVRKFEAYDAESMEHTYHTWCAVLTMVLKHGGGNDFHVPHTGVRTRQQAGALSMVAKVDRDIVRNTLEVLKDMNERAEQA